MANFAKDGSRRRKEREVKGDENMPPMSSSRKQQEVLVFWAECYASFDSTWLVAEIF